MRPHAAFIDKRYHPQISCFLRITKTEGISAYGIQINMFVTVGSALSGYVNGYVTIYQVSECGWSRNSDCVISRNVFIR